MSSSRSSASSAFSAASASATPLSSSSKEGISTSSTVLISLGALITLLALILATIWFAGYADDVTEWWAKRYYKAKALTEIKVMQNSGSEKVEGMLKDSLKSNPVMGEDELEKVSGGLGNEAISEGLGGVSDKLGGLGKL